MEALGVIPARGGSVRIPRKNMREVGGKPLVQWTIEAALASKLTRVVVATEDPEIAALAIRLGADIAPRSVESATSSGMSARVVADTLDYMKAAYGYEPDTVCLLHPTSPFRDADDINGAIDIQAFGQSVISFTADELNGAIYVTDVETFQRAGTFFVSPIHPHLLDERAGLDIDTWDDLERARSLV